MAGNEKPSSGRITGLDTLRGIAALIVVFRHYYGISPVPETANWLFEYTPLHHLIAGRHAVILFFVLSGFVLSIPYFRGHRLKYPRFIIKRIFRIYVPFLVGICAAGLLWMIIAAPDLTQFPPGKDWSQSVTLLQFIAHVLMIGLIGTTALNPPMWTLIIEMRVSFLFPALVSLVKRWPLASLIGSVIVSYGAAKLYANIDGSLNFFVSETVFGAVLLTIYYIQFFMIGVFISSKAEQIKQFFQNLPAELHMIIMAVIIFIPLDVVTSRFIFHDLWFAITAAYFIICCISYGCLNRALSGGVFGWLGKVSYSMYLIHLPVLLSVYYAFGQSVPVYIVLIIAFPLILLASEIMNRYVERPAMKLGKVVTNSMR